MNTRQPGTTTEQIWRELSERLRRFVRSRVRTDVDVDDILQIVFLRIHKKLADVRQVERLQSWVFQITRNAIADHFRHRTSSQLDTSSIAAPANETESAGQALADCVSALIDHLPPDQQRSVSMYERDGLSQQEIADRESISLSGVKSRIQRGRKNLESMLRACCQWQFDVRGNVFDYEPLENGCGQHCDGGEDCE